MVSIFGLEDISSKIKETNEKNNTALEFKLQLDKANKRLSNPQSSFMKYEIIQRKT